MSRGVETLLTGVDAEATGGGVGLGAALGPRGFRGGSRRLIGGRLGGCCGCWGRLLGGCGIVGGFSGAWFCIGGRRPPGGMFMGPPGPMPCGLVIKPCKTPAKVSFMCSTCCNMVRNVSSVTKKRVLPEEITL